MPMMRRVWETEGSGRGFSPYRSITRLCEKFSEREKEVSRLVSRAYDVLLFGRACDHPSASYVEENMEMLGYSHRQHGNTDKENALKLILEKLKCNVASLNGDESVWNVAMVLLMLRNADHASNMPAQQMRNEQDLAAMPALECSEFAMIHPQTFDSVNVMGQCVSFDHSNRTASFSVTIFNNTSLSMKLRKSDHQFLRFMMLIVTRIFLP